MNNLIIYTDGGSRGNPGPAACAFVAFVGTDVVGKGSKYLGVTTNNTAEYQGVILALQWLFNNKDRVVSVDFYLDSQLVYKQLIGEYKIKSETIRGYVYEIKNIEDDIGITPNYYHVPRSKNKLADRLVNIELDKSH